MTVTAPLAKPTASWERSSVAVKADIGNGFFPLLIANVLRQVGNPVFLTGLSKAQTFSTGAFVESVVLGSSYCCIVMSAPPVTLQPSIEKDDVQRQ